MKKSMTKAAKDSAEKDAQEKIEKLLRQFFDLRGVRISSQGIKFLRPSDHESASIRAEADKLITCLKQLPGGQEAYDELVPRYLRGELDSKGWPQQVRKLTRAQKKRLATITAVFDQCQAGKTVVHITEARAEPYFAIFESLGVAQEEYSEGPYTPDWLSLVTGPHRHRTHVLSAMEIRSVRIISPEIVAMLLRQAEKIVASKFPRNRRGTHHDKLIRTVQFLNDLAGVKPHDNT